MKTKVTLKVRFVHHHFLQSKNGDGFTLIELLVVMSIMVLLITAIVLNLAGQRASRDIKIAQNQLVSNIRKAQSYTLSARTLPSGAAVQYYILKFDSSKPQQYTIQAVYNASSNPQLQDVETDTFPPNIQLAATNPVVITRSVDPTTQDPSCALAAFAAPFAKVIFNNGCQIPNVQNSNPPAIDISNTADDYGKILNFVVNITCDNGGPVSCSASTDSVMTITLTDKANTMSKTVSINAVTGAVIFN